MISDFFLRALIAGAGVACIAGPLGCFVVWRRMAYFGDTMAHSALLGVVLGMLLGIAPIFGVIAVTTVIAVTLSRFGQRARFSSDTLLGILAHATLSLGLVAISLLAVQVDLLSYLFGELLAVSMVDIYWIYGVGAAVLITLAMIWRPLLAMTVSEELAQVEGVPVMWLRLGFMLLMALLIAVAMKIVGVLLITALLIIPAAAARSFARGPEMMAGIAVLIGLASVVGGLYGSLWLDTPSGPSIVVAVSLFFCLSLAIGRGQFAQG
jgi:zinc transport system permease protein